MTETFYPLCTEKSTEASTTFYPDNILSTYTSEDLTESITNNTLISSINSMVTFQNNLRQRNTSTKELPNEVLLNIFNNLNDLKDILNLRCVSKKFKSLCEVKLYDIIEEKIKSLENKKKSLERRLSHMKNHLCPRLSHYKVFLNVISRSDVSELCNLPKPPREFKYIFSVLYMLYTGGKHCCCLQCLSKKNKNRYNTRSHSICCGGIINGHGTKRITRGHSFSSGSSISDFSTRTSSPYSVNSSTPSSHNSSRNHSRRNSFDHYSSMNNSKVRKSSIQSDSGLLSSTIMNCKRSESIRSTAPLSNRCHNHDTASSTVSKPKEIEEEIEIPNWEEVRQVINKNDFRNWVMNLHSKLDTVPKEHILLANNLLNKPRGMTSSKASSNGDSTTSEYENLRLTYDRMLIVSQIGYKILLFVEAIIQSFFLTERFEEQKNSISLVYKQIHQWKDLQLQCKN